MAAILTGEEQQHLLTQPSGQPTPILRHPNSLVLMDTLAVADLGVRLDTMGLSSYTGDAYERRST
jgi:hypothetical protein